MNRLVLLLSAIIICTSCGKDEPKDEPFAGLENITFENYPKVDGSTSASVLNTMVACKLLGINCHWLPPGVSSEWVLSPVWDEVPSQYYGFFGERIKTSQTHGAFMNLINGEVDIIVTHRTVSLDEKQYANACGVTLIETSVAADAFVFIVNPDNPVKSLTVNQIQKIYTGEITNWAQAGGNNAEMKVFTRPRNSGSEEVFRTLVMDGMEPADFPEAIIHMMFQVFGEVIHDADAICYTFNTYKELQARYPESVVPKIAINGISANETTIKNRTYPFISEVHIAIRSDLDHNSLAYKLYQWLQSDHAKPTLIECGFIPK
jgi:phosphate transport system substrate-binding protein